MRLLFPAASLLAIAAPALPAKVPPVQKPSSECPGAASQWTREGRAWNLKPRKLAELPPAETYAAVYRLDERGCMVPVKFRDTRR